MTYQACFKHSLRLQNIANKTRNRYVELVRSVTRNQIKHCHKYKMIYFQLKLFSSTIFYAMLRAYIELFALSA